MAVKIKDLQMKEIRKVITVTYEDNTKDTVTIYNPIGVRREQLFNLFSRVAVGSEDYSEKDILRDILKICTDLYIHKRNKLEEIIENPTLELAMILREVDEIYAYIEYEFLAQKIKEINRATNNIMTTLASEKVKNLAELSEELEIAHTPIDDLENELEDFMKEMEDESESTFEESENTNGEKKM